MSDVKEKTEEFDILSISDKLKEGDLEKLINARATASNNAFMVRISEQVPDLDEIIDSISKSGIFKQEVDVLPKVKVGFITLSTGAGDEARSFAMGLLKDDKIADNQDAFDRIIRRRSLAHGIYSFNGKNLHGIPTDVIDNPSALGVREEAEKNRVDATYKFLTQYSDVIVRRIEAAYFTWGDAIERKMWGDEIKTTAHVSEALGN